MSNINGRAALHRLCAIAILSSGCAIDAQNCPNIPYDGYWWPKNSTVYYDITQLDSAGQSAVSAAFGDWNSANQSDGSNVTFKPATSANPANWIWTNVSGTTAFGYTCTAAATALAATCENPRTGAISTAITVVNLTATTPSGTPLFKPSAPGYSTALQKNALHEIGHTMGENDTGLYCGSGTTSVMNGFCGTNDHSNGVAQDLSSNCDSTNVKSNTAYGGSSSGSGSPQGPGTQTGQSDDGCSGDPPNDSCICVGNSYECGCGGSAPPCSGGDNAVCYNGQWTCGQANSQICYDAAPDCPEGMQADCLSGAWICEDDTGGGGLSTCSTGEAGNCSDCEPPTCSGSESWNPELCSCYQNGSPIIIDTDGSGFHLTSPAGGVVFDFFGNGHRVQMAWTARGSTNGWLALDRNGNGVIDDARELFGNITEQPPSRDRNGFRALAVFDEPENGGNGDGIIDSQDAVWPKLLVWIDSNHDGISQPEELHRLDDVGIHSIGLMYTESRHKDAYGNAFRYRGSLNPDRRTEVDRVIYDVFLSIGPG